MIVKTIDCCYRYNKLNTDVEDASDEDEGPAPMRRLPLLAHGSVSSLRILCLLAGPAVLFYGGFLVTQPSAQDERLCASWLQQYNERVNNTAIFKKVGCEYTETTAMTHGIYSVVDIYLNAPCKEMPRPVKTYFTNNKLGIVMFVRLHAAGEDSPFLTNIF